MAMSTEEARTELRRRLRGQFPELFPEEKAPRVMTVLEEADRYEGVLHSRPLLWGDETSLKLFKARHRHRVRRWKLPR